MSSRRGAEIFKRDGKTGIWLFRGEGYAHEFGRIVEKLEFVMNGNPLIMKLRRFADLDANEIRTLEAICPTPRVLARGDKIVQEGDRPDTVSLLLSGLACRYKVAEDGSRQIVGFMVPGDVCDLHVFILKQMDHGIEALSPVRVCEIARDNLLEIFGRDPNITRALWWSTLVDESTLREWVLNVTTRPALQRTAHLLSELCMRLETVGLSGEGKYELHLTQEDLSDAVGMTRSHVSLSLAKMQEDGLLKLHRGKIEVVDVERLKTLGEFNSAYLHLEKALGSTHREGPRARIVE
jgi:CRP-like cAMP-binding protein